jgi:hypothetical protein
MRRSSFQEACIDAFGCAPERWERIVFWRCLYEHAEFPARLILRFHPSFFDRDLQLIRAIAGASSVSELENETNDHYYRHPPMGFLRASLRIRVSGRKILTLGIKVFGTTRTGLETMPRNESHPRGSFRNVLTEAGAGENAPAP